MTSQSENIVSDDRETIVMTKPTAWPMVLAAGVALIAAGVATNLVISAMGLVLLAVAITGWIGQLTPGNGKVAEPLVAPERRARPIGPSGKKVAALRPGLPGNRMHLPEKVHPYSAGAKGGLAGGALMAMVATLYGLVSGRGIWYPINLLAAMILPRFAGQSPQRLDQFDLSALLVGTVIHLLVSVLVGLFFGILLPTLPRSPVFWGGVVGPLLWTGAIYSFMGVLNPVMNRNVDWAWFIASQFVYGLTVGIVVVRSEKIVARRVGGGAANVEPEDGAADE